MIQALIVAILATLLAFIARYDRMKYALPLAFVVITVFLSLGYEWGNDVPVYYSIFENYNSYSLFDFESYKDIDQKTEFGWVFINQMCAPIGFYGMRAVLFAFENIVIFLLIKRVVAKEYYWLAVFIYTMNPYFMILSSSMMRQWLAMCLVILGFLYLEKRKWGVYVVLILIAFSIHRSSLVCMPLVFLPRLINNYKSSSLALWIFVFLIYFFLSGMVVSNLVSWMQSEAIYYHYENPDSVGFLSAVQLGIIIFICSHLQQIEQDKRIYVAVMLGYILILPLFTFSSLASRLGYYFLVFSIVAYPIFLGQSRVSNAIKYVFIAAVITITFYNFSSFFVHPTWFKSYGKYTTLIEAGILNF